LRLASNHTKDAHLREIAQPGSDGQSAVSKLLNYHSQFFTWGNQQGLARRVCTLQERREFALEWISALLVVMKRFELVGKLFQFSLNSLHIRALPVPQCPEIG
jgi:hypothetical protein